LHATTAFSLIEVTLALGVAAFALIAILGMLPVGLNTQQVSVRQTTANSITSQVLGVLRAAVRHPGNSNKQFDLQHFPKGGAWDPEPDVLYFTNEGNSVGSAITPDSVYRATINYFQPPDPQYTTSLANITVSWPPQADPTTGVVAGKVETFVAINR